jgi:hypothetical protein
VTFKTDPAFCKLLVQTLDQVDRAVLAAGAAYGDSDIAAVIIF